MPPAQALTVELGDPAWFPDGLDLDAGNARFVRAGRAALSAQPFLDDKWRHEGLPCVAAPMPALPAAPVARPRLHFLWHTSFCASTVLAAALDTPGKALALKEPQVLIDLADVKRGARGRIADLALARGVFGLLARRFDPREQVLVKPSNSANALIEEAAALTEGGMLLLHSDCESFLVSIARAGQAGVSYVRELFMTLAADGHPAGRWRPNDLFKLTDLQLAALVWRMQMDALEAASARLGDRARSLDCRRFTEDPCAVLTALDRFFGLGLGRAGVGAVLDGPLLRRDAKTPSRGFDAEARAAEGRAVRARLGPDLAAVMAWQQRLFPAPPRLARPLQLDAGPARGPGEMLDAAAAKR
jgi:hypothetical protein